METAAFLSRLTALPREQKDLWSQGGLRLSEPRLPAPSSARLVFMAVWRHLGNVQRIIDVSLASLFDKVPEARDARFDFATRTFRTGEGEPLTDDTLRKWAVAVGGDRAASAGSGTLKRGIFLNSLAVAVRRAGRWPRRTAVEKSGTSKLLGGVAQLTKSSIPNGLNGFKYRSRGCSS